MKVKKSFFIVFLVFIISMMPMTVAYAGGYSQLLRYNGWSGDYGFKSFLFRCDSSYRSSYPYAYHLSRFGWKSKNDYIYPPDVGNGKMHQYGVKMFDMQGSELAHITVHKGSDANWIPAGSIVWFNTHTGGTGCWMPNGEGYFRPLVTIEPPYGFAGYLTEPIKDFYVNVN